MSHVVRWQGLSPQVWKNGGGVTREIWAEGKAGGGFDWRVSVAEVTAAGPFSLFPGYDRIIMPLSTHGMRLMNGRSLIADLQPQAPFGFAGELDVRSELPHGPVSDFNLMVRRAHGRPDVVVMRLTPGSAQPLPDHCRLLFVMTGSCEVNGTQLGERDALVCGQHAIPPIAGSGLLACCRILPPAG